MYGTPNPDAAACLCAVAATRAQAPRHDVRLIRTEVRQHSFASGGHPNTWGVWPVWEYADKPGTEFGGPFYSLAYLRALAQTEED